MKHNFHTHTFRCKHAAGADEDYVQAALENGFDALGFSDHVPWAFATDYVSHCRMLPSQWADYKQSVLKLREKYQGRIAIRLGAESEFYPKYIDQLRRLKDDGCEYLLLGNHFLYTEEEYPYVCAACEEDRGVYEYAEQAVEAIRTGLYNAVAHPDLYLSHRQELNRACMEAADMICQAAKEANIPIEYNLLGLRSELTGQSRGYPNQDFWAYARKWNNDVILGVDAHDPVQLREGSVWEEALRRLHALDYHLVDNL